MKVAYFDCFSGISGDMIIGALIDLGLDINFLKKELEKLNLKNYKIEAKKVVKSGITATKFDVIEDKNTKKSAEPIFLSNHHEERNLNVINNIVGNSKLESKIKDKIKKIYLIIANAESKIHGKAVDKIHFHEIGAIDTIIDVAGALIGLEKLGVDSLYCSKLNVGTGFVDFSHGRFPVPAPATVEILKGVPIYNNGIEAELVTPTGAAIITALAEKFADMPAMKVSSIGYGAGSRDLSQPNVLRAFLGNLYENSGDSGESISIIESNMDNMNPEIYPYVIEKLMENGALDAYLESIIMKKGRPAVKLTALCEIGNEDSLCGIIFDETTTLGVRIFRAERKILGREIKNIKTEYGSLRVKVSKSGGRIMNITPEYEDCVKIAREKKIPLKKVYWEANISRVKKTLKKSIFPQN